MKYKVCVVSIIPLISPIRRLWRDHWRAILITLALVVVLVWGLAFTQPHKLVEGVYTLQAGKCFVDYHTSIQSVGLACPGVDFTYLWPLPVMQPWPDPTDTPEPGPGWYAITPSVIQAL